MCLKMAAILDFWPFGGHKKTKKQIFQNRYIRFVERHTRKVYTKFQDPSMYGVQMNVPFVLYKISCGFLHLTLLYESFLTLRPPSPVSLIKQARIIIHTILNLWKTSGIEPLTSGLKSVYQSSSSNT